MKIEDIAAGMLVRAKHNFPSHITAGREYKVLRVVDRYPDIITFYPVHCDLKSDNCSTCHAVGWGYGRIDGHVWFEFYEEAVILSPEEEAKAVNLDMSKISDLERFVK